MAIGSRLRHAVLAGALAAPVVLALMLYPYFVGQGGASGPVVRGVSFGDVSPGAFVWNGFRHSWTYNHRLSRMGDWLGETDCKEVTESGRWRRRCTGTLFHTGASGAGGDELEFTSYYTGVQAEEIAFWPGRARLHFDGDEEELLVEEMQVSAPALPPMRDRQRYVVLLNGYDIRNVGGASAKKVQHFRVGILEQPSFDPATGELRFRVGASLNMNCDSVECSTQSDRVEYALDVHFLVIAADDDMRVSGKKSSVSYDWDRERELTEDAIPANRELQYIGGERGDFSQAMLGFTEIGVDLRKNGAPKDHWFVEWTHAIRDVRYDPTSGLARYDLDLLFKEWNRRTRRKVSSLASKGAATLEARVVLVQMRQAVTRREYDVGRIAWPGKNQSPNTRQARWEKSLMMDAR